MSIPLRARRDFPYAGHRLKVGQDFEARTNSDAKLLKAIGHAEERPEGEYKTRVMTAEQPAQSVTIPLVTKADDLDGMDADELRALADSLDVYVHHRAGAERIRQAIRESRKSSE